MKTDFALLNVEVAQRVATVTHRQPAYQCHHLATVCRADAVG